MYSILSRTKEFARRIRISDPHSVLNNHKSYGKMDCRNLFCKVYLDISTCTYHLFSLCFGQHIMVQKFWVHVVTLEFDVSSIVAQKLLV
jgi:hypothetical protein